MKKKSCKILIGTMVLSIFATVGCVDKGGSSSAGGEDNTLPVITVEDVPISCMVGETVEIPAAVATDDVDGDISSKVKVTVSLMKDDGVSVSRDLLYEKAGNVTQKVNITSNTLFTYNIVYTVKDNAGNKAEKKFVLTSIADNETGTLTIDETSIDGFSLEQGITVTAGSNVVLPVAKAIDQPNSKDISSRVEAKIYEVINGVQEEIIFASYSDFTKVKSVQLPVGEYNVVYSVIDVAGNLFPQAYTISVNVTSPKDVNLIGNLENFVYSKQDGMSWANEYGELCVGNTSAKANLEQTVGFTEQVAKIHEQYVGISFNADVPGANGQTFYTLSARGSKDRTTMPNVMTCTWPQYLFLRIEKNRIISRVEKVSDAPMTAIKEYNGMLLDGNDHTIYVQWLNVGESAEAEDAAIMLYGWVDMLPNVGYENASFAYKAIAGEEFAEGTLTKSVFEELWNQSGAGWFSMDTYAMNRPYDDDHMRIKGFVIYDKEETEFAADIIAPVVSSKFTDGKILALGEETIVPLGSVKGADSLSCYVVDANGVKTQISGGLYTPMKTGAYKLLYEAYDDAGNLGYKVFNFTVAQEDYVAPELIISSESTIETKVGEYFTIPTAQANDNLDGSLTSRIKVFIQGTEYVTELLPGDAYYPMTEGVQKLIYQVTDSYGNMTQKEVTVNVATSIENGNVLSSPMEIANEGKGLGSQEYLYDQKVSMVLNVSEIENLVMFNVRGKVVNTYWPQGLVIRLLSSGKVNVSAYGHDSAIFGETSLGDWSEYLNKDILFEYQVKNVKIGSEEYIRVQIWVNGEALVFTPSVMFNGMNELEEGVDAIYRLVGDFDGDQKNNIYSSPFWVACYNANITIKELRFDGTSCTLKA